MLLSLDMSLRSTGVTVLDEENNLIHFEVIKTTQEEFLFDEDLILFIQKKIGDLILKYRIDKVVIEGISLNSKSPRMDFICGMYWGIRSIIRKYHPSIPIGSVPVLSWRNAITTKEERKWAKQNCRDWQKNVVFRKLPDDVMKKFLIYVEKNGMKIESIYDLSDSYWLGVYRNSLD